MEEKQDGGKAGWRKRRVEEDDEKGEGFQETTSEENFLAFLCVGKKLVKIDETKNLLGIQFTGILFNQQSNILAAITDG